MAKSGKAPKGYYSASQVMRRLGIGSSTLYHFVDVGKIKRIVPPDMREGYYPQEDVDKMVRAREMFLLTYSKDTATFSRATEEDVQGIYDVTASHWNNNPSYEDRLARYRKNPYIYYVVKKEGIVVGFLGMTPLKEKALERVMAENFQPVDLGPDNILPFIPGQPIENLFLDIVVRKGVKSEPYGMRLLEGGREVLEDFAKQGSPVHMMYAASSTPDGIKLCRDIGFTELPAITGASRKRFELNPSNVKSPYLKKYQEILKQTKSERSSENHEQNLTAELTAVTADNNGQSRTITNAEPKKHAQRPIRRRTTDSEKA